MKDICTKHGHSTALCQDRSMYKAWTCNGTVPGPVIRVQERDTLHFQLENMDPSVDHSIDFHSVYAAPDKDFADVKPNETGTFSYDVGSRGVYMYHCATEPVLTHIANGMYGTMIVEPGMVSQQMMKSITN